MYEELRGVTEYFGEEYAAADATRVLRIVRDFVLLFEKGMADIKVRGAGGRMAGMLHAWRCGAWRQID